jgi:hypothetical protein
MAVTNQFSDNYANMIAVPPILNVRPYMVQYVPLTHTQVGAGDATSTVTIYRIQAGSRIVLPLSFMKWSALGASTLLQFGWQAYTEAGGAAVVADPDGLFAGLNTAAAGGTQLSLAPTMGAGLDAHLSRAFKGTANLVFTITGAVWPAAAVISLVLAIAPAG